MFYGSRESYIKFFFTALMALGSSANLEGQENRVLRKADFSSEIKDFKRSSLLLMMVENEEKQHFGSIQNTFEQIPIPDKFNDHSIHSNALHIKSESKDISAGISEQLKEADIAKKLVAKWFNRSKEGFFDLELVKTRGLYNASTFDIQIAKNTLRGNATLEDAGEELIANTFVIVNDYKYTNKEKVVSKGKSILNEVGSLLGSRKAQTVQNSATAGAIDVLAKGYVIKTISYLYRLVWDEATASTFYGEMWVTGQAKDTDRIKKFNDSNSFKLVYIGRQEAWADVQSTKYTTKTETQLIERATIKATNAAIAKLERKFEVFRTKTPLVSIEPIAAKIGTKEGIKKGDKFEVLEQLVSEDGSVEYKKVAEIAIDPAQIWDNSYLPENAPDSDLEYSIFKGNAKKLYPGMLIRFKKNTNIFK